MARQKDTKRENFEVTPEQQAEIEYLQQFLDAASKKDAVLTAVRVTLHLLAELKDGNQLFVGTAEHQTHRRLVLLGVEKPKQTKWMYLVDQAHPWKRQLFVKGRKLPAAVVWSTMVANDLSVKEASDNWELPKEAVNEIVEYCQSNKALLEMEADEELRRLEDKGISVVPKAAY